MSKTYKCVYRLPHYNGHTDFEGILLLNADSKKRATAWFGQHFHSDRVLISVAPATKADIKAYLWQIDDACDPVIELIEQICREKMPSIEKRGGLDIRWNDTDDFPEVCIWTMKAAMVAIYHAGVEYGRKYGQGEVLGIFPDDPA